MRLDHQHTIYDEMQCAVGVFVTALYSFRMFFLVFHGEERMDKETKSHLHETPWVVTVPLILLAIPSAIIGWMTMGPVLFGDGRGREPRTAETFGILGLQAERAFRPIFEPRVFRHSP